MASPHGARAPRLLFLHGAGGYDEDQVLAQAIGEAAGVPILLPRLPDKDMSYAAWAAAITAELSALDQGDVVIGHSFGASILLRVLADATHNVAGALLLAMPNWDPSGWDVADYAFNAPVPSVPLVLHHCRDDEVVPFEHLALNAAQVPSATVREHAFGGHQLVGLEAAIASDVAVFRRR